MAGLILARLAEQGIELPQASVPVANYVPFTVVGNMVHLAGQIPRWNGELRHVGAVGRDVSVEEAYQAARVCALNLIAQLQVAVGDLDRVRRVVKLNVFVRSDAAFVDQPKVANGASDVMVEVFGDAGKHARSAVGVMQLPLGVAVEVDAVVVFD